MQDLSGPRAQPGYTSWAAVAGFLDGDGSVEVDPREYILHWVISFSDNWLPQIEQVREFLIGQGISVGKPRRVGSGAWMCEVAEIKSPVAMATQMLNSGGICKKQRELTLLLDYYLDKVTGTEVIAGFNDEVRLGKRIGKIKHLDMPYTHSAGFARARYASRYEQRALSVVDSKRMVDEYLVIGTTCRTLAQKYDVSVSTISRILNQSGISRRPRQRIVSSFSDVTDGP